MNKKKILNIDYIKKLKTSQTFNALMLIIFVLWLIFFIYSRSRVNPINEANNMARLELMKTAVEISEFETDGCSGNISQAWTSAVNRISRVSSDFAERYSDARNIPFEFACIEHDLVYHRGEGGFAGRLEADNILRNEIINYAINNVDDIRSRTNLQTNEEVLALYDVIAEAVYRAVRIGGGPCSGRHYAWGFGYGGGHCDDLDF